MRPEERAEVLLTARMLRAASHMRWLAVAFTTVPAAAVVFGVGARGGMIVAIALGIVTNVYAFRVALDARLFEDVATDRLSTPELDGALAAIGRAQRGERRWSDRCRGARRLLIHGSVAVVAQLVAILAGALS